MKTIVAILGLAAIGIAGIAVMNLAGTAESVTAQKNGDESECGSEDAEKKERELPPGVVRDGSPPVEFPEVVPEATPNVVVSNPGASVAVSRFYRLLQDAELKTTDVVAAPFQFDGRKVIDNDKELAAFFEKAREGSIREGRTNTLMQMTFLPAGNTWEEAQRWLAPTMTGDRAKALFDHANEHDAWVVMVLLARTRGDTHIVERTLIAVTDADSEEKARVIGFMD